MRLVTRLSRRRPVRLLGGGSLAAPIGAAGRDRHRAAAQEAAPTPVARVIRAFAAAVLLLLLFARAPSRAAQPVERPCVAEDAPADDFQSHGIGLTAQELERLYGERQIGQGSLVFDYQGVQLHKVGCDVILTFPRDGGGGPMDEFALAEALLPTDAEPMGRFARGTTIHSEQPASLWWSDSLAARFDALGAARGGAILVLFTYESQGMEDGPIQRVELRTLELPA